jgi:hypothetical protein
MCIVKHIGDETLEGLAPLSNQARWLPGGGRLHLDPGAGAVLRRPAMTTNLSTGRPTTITPHQ